MIDLTQATKSDDTWRLQNKMDALYKMAEERGYFAYHKIVEGSGRFERRVIYRWTEQQIMIECTLINAWLWDKYQMWVYISPKLFGGPEHFYTKWDVYLKNSTEKIKENMTEPLVAFIEGLNEAVESIELPKNG